MKSTFSKSWTRSKQPRKQRKYRFNAPLHLKGKFLHTHLSKELSNKYNKKALRVRTGDKVKILRGNYKGEEHKVEEVSLGTERVFLEKVSITKVDGSKAKIAFNASNLMITNLNTDDKNRLKRLKTKGEK